VIHGAVQLRSGAPLGIYIHVPFCAQRCPYCDYPVVEERPTAQDPYRTAILDELEARAADVAGRALETIYLGGGTPSSVPTVWIEEWVEAIRRRWPESEPTVTLETNPEDVDVERLEAWERIGVDRLILGLQSFQEETLDRLGRVHSPEEGLRAFDRASASEGLRAGVDLLFGGPGQKMREWRADLEHLVAADGRPAGLYLYEYAPRRRSAVELESGSAGSAAEMFEDGKEAAAAMGLSRTGVASFETDGFAGRHTRGYWIGWEYLGLGMAASSLRLPGEGGAKGTRAAVRRRNAGAVADYLADPTGHFEEERLEARAYFAERLALGMRSAVGVGWEEIERQFGGVLSETDLRQGRQVLERLVESGRARRCGTRIRPTDAGLDVADGVDREVRRCLATKFS